jgi:hypothetical protein
MRSNFTRLITVSVAAVIAAAAIAPASAATHHKRAAPAQAESPASNPDVVGLPIHPAWSPIPAAVYQAPNGCFTDEGYGRYTSCEQGGS